MTILIETTATNCVYDVIIGKPRFIQSRTGTFNRHLQITKLHMHTTTCRRIVQARTDHTDGERRHKTQIHTI